MTHRLRQSACEDIGDARPLLRVFQLRIFRRDVLRQVGFLEDPFSGVLIGGGDEIRLDSQFLRHRLKKLLGLFRLYACILAFFRCQRLVGPEGLPVTAPVKREGPARQAFARIPLALPVMEEPARREPFAQAADQLVSQPPLHRTDSGGVPFGAFEIVDRNEGRLTAHRQAHVAFFKRGVDGAPCLVQFLPRLVRKGLRDARMFGDPRDLHVETEFRFGKGRRPRNRRRVSIMRRRGEGDVAFPSQQAGSRVEADPSGARDVDLNPGMEIGEVVIGAGRAVQSLHIGFKLDQITRHEPCGQAQMAEDLHQKPA